MSEPRTIWNRERKRKGLCLNCDNKVGPHRRCGATRVIFESSHPNAAPATANADRTGRRRRRREAHG